jgi:hypothetical protein
MFVGLVEGYCPHVLQIQKCVIFACVNTGSSSKFTDISTGLWGYTWNIIVEIAEGDINVYQGFFLHQCAVSWYGELGLGILSRKLCGFT